MKTAVFLFFLVAVPAAWSIKCYTCSDCGDSKGEETDCTSLFDKCLKVYGKSSDGKEATARSCANQAVCDAAQQTCDAAKKLDSKAVCEAPCCDSDLCNAGAAPTFSLLLVSLCSLFAVAPFFK